MTAPDYPRSPDLPAHPVRVVAQRTGLSSHVLRAWERRYGVVTPVRSEGGQRLYSDADIERLGLLRALTESGYSIGQLAQLPVEELHRLDREKPAGPSEAATAAEGIRAAASRAIERFDGPGLRHALQSAAVGLGVPRFLDDVVAPLLTEIGEQWRGGRMTIAHEHLATAAVRQVLGWVRETAEGAGSAPMLIVATPPGQRHEGGAMLVAASAAAEGWRVTYLGADLPVREIADAVRRTRARAVALSLLHPSDDREMGGHLAALRDALPRDIPVLVGGSAAGAYAREVAAAGAEVVPDLPAFRRVLHSLAPSADAGL